MYKPQIFLWTAQTVQKLSHALKTQFDLEKLQIIEK